MNSCIKAESAWWDINDLKNTHEIVLPKKLYALLGSILTDCF